MIILTGIIVGVVASALLRIYFRALNEGNYKRPAVALAWMFYALSIFLVATFSQAMFEYLGVLEKLEKSQQHVYLLSWFVPVVLMCGFSFYQLLKRLIAKRKRSS